MNARTAARRFRRAPGRSEPHYPDVRWRTWALSPPTTQSIIGDMTDVHQSAFRKIERAFEIRDELRDLLE